jgi:hypothetical protein
MFRNYERRNNYLRKQTLSAIGLIIVFAVSVFMAGIPTAAANTPPLQVPTWAYVSASPNPVGVGQQALIIMWINAYPPTAIGDYGDRWHGFQVTVTKPDGSKQTLGSFSSDPVGSAYTSYVPDQVGNYTLQFSWPGQTLTGEPAPPGGYPKIPFDFGAAINNTYLAATSDPVVLVVQQQLIQEYTETPLPTGYWTRPIYDTNRLWAQVAANWLGGAAQNIGSTTNFNYGTGPESAHVLWTRPYWAGGIMDARFGDTAYYNGLSYEQFWSTSPIVLNGKLYYNVGVNPREGWHCVDLYTGETEYFHNTTGPVMGVGSGTFDSTGSIPGTSLAFGQIYDYESPNQHGGFPYLWSTGFAGDSMFGIPASTTWQMFDAFTGNYICSIANVSAVGTNVYGKDGSILYYNIVGSGANQRLTVWNTSQVIMSRPSIGTFNFALMWRPYFNYTFDGNKGFSLNVSIPSVQGRILAIRDGQYLIGGTSGKNNGTFVQEGNLWALNLDPAKGALGSLLWDITYTPPQTVVTDVVVLANPYGSSYGVMMGPFVDPEDGVFFFSEPMTRQWWGFSLETGQQLWKSEPEGQWNYYGMSYNIYNGMLLSYGYSGQLVSYEATTGKVLWTWDSGTVGTEDFYGSNAPLSMACIADGKMYLYSTEHSPSQPLRRDAFLWCVNASDGKLIWKIQCWPNGASGTGGQAGAIIADGCLITLDNFDGQLYCFGKGPSEITVQAPLTAVQKGASVLLTGTVTDQSSGAKDTPAISDSDQEAWMEYLYQQKAKPEDAKGVPVHLTAIDPNSNFQDIGTTTSDIDGNFGIAWVPLVEGKYQVTATFEGSAAYGDSMATTYFVVDPTVAASAVNPVVNPTSPAETSSPTTPAQSTSPLVTEAPQPPTSGTPTETYIAVGVAVVVIVAIAAALVLRRRK